MRAFLVRLVASAAGLAVAAWILGGISVGSAGDTVLRRVLTLLGVALVFGVVNAVVKPVVKLLTLPLFLLTLGLITLVINALLLQLTAWISDQVGLHFTVSGFGTALVGAIIVSLVSFGVALSMRD
ncbi:MAG TPA: phage holin family protein [Mycobacteriales bacterium]|jgi:putative membrane protein